jgi:replicative DNA helicase
MNDEAARQGRPDSSCIPGADDSNPSGEIEYGHDRDEIDHDELEAVLRNDDEPERLGLDDFNDIPDLSIVFGTNGSGPHTRTRTVDGATFVLNVPDRIPAVWGDDNGVAWAEGEGLMLVGPDGVGKTSVAQQLVLARIGIRDGLLGIPVKPAAGRVLYIAADRPRQAASSLRRMVMNEHTDQLRDGLIVWRGPLEFDVTKEPRALREFVDSIGNVSDVVVDSLKDIAPDLAKDETGSRVSIAFQELIASGYELLVLHHQRKEQQNAAKPKRLADVYGSRWLTAGMGSVLLLWGEPGDLVVEFKHLKQPEAEIGPFNLVHDHGHGITVIQDRIDLAEAVRRAPHGYTVQDAAILLFETATPSKNQIEKARRALSKLADAGRVRRLDDPDGLARYHDPARTA